MTAIMSAQISVALQPLVLNLNPHTILDDEMGASAVAGLTFNSNGQLSFTGNTAPPSPDLNEWIRWQAGFSQGALFQVAYTTLVSGVGPTAGPGLGAYGALSSNRAWSLSVGAGGSATGVWRFRVREIADTANFAQADMTVTAFSAPAI